MSSWGDCECGCGWKSGWRGRCEQRLAKLTNCFFPKCLTKFIDNPCRCRERRTPFLLVFSFELTITCVLLMIGYAGGKVSAKIFKMQIEQGLYEVVSLISIIVLLFCYTTKNFRLGLLWIAYKPVYLFGLGCMALDPAYWKPIWVPIVLLFRALCTLILTPVIWDYCKRLKDRELTGFWVNSEVDIRERKKNPLFRDVDSSDSLDEESFTLITTESAGSLHFKMVREDIVKRDSVRARREAHHRALQQRNPRKTRRQLEIEYVERVRREAAHRGRKKLRKRLRLRREQEATAMKVILGSRAHSLPYNNRDIQVYGVPKYHDLHNEMLYEDMRAQQALKREERVNDKVQLFPVNKQRYRCESTANVVAHISLPTDSSRSLLDEGSQGTIFGRGSRGSIFGRGSRATIFQRLSRGRFFGRAGSRATISGPPDGLPKKK